MNEKLAGEDPLFIGGHVSILGAVQHEVKLDAFEFDTEPQTGKYADAKVQVFPGQLSIEPDKAMSAFAAHGDWAGFTLENERGEGFSASDFKLTSDYDFSEYTYGAGRFLVILDEMKLISDHTEQPILKGLSILNTVTANDQAIDWDVAVSMDELNPHVTNSPIPKGTVASSVSNITNMKLLYAVRGLNVQKLEALLEKVEGLSLSLNSLPQEQQQAAILQQLLPAYEGLLQPGFEYEMGLSMDLDSENVAAKARVTLVDALLMTDFMAALANPEALTSKLSIAANVQFPNSLIPTESAALMDNSPWFKSSEDYSILDFSLLENQIILNEESFSVPEFLGVVLGAR